MGSIALPGTPPIEVHLRRSARARRLSLRVSSLDGKVTLTLPLRVAEREGRAFLAEREGWLRRALAGQPAAAEVGPGTELPVEGRALVLVPGPVRSARIEAGRLIVPQGREAAAVRAYLKALARDRLSARVDHHAARLGRPVAGLSLRDTRSRWGSCTQDGRLMFSWRLAMAPPAVLDYVAAHEVAHLERMDHSPAFWAVTERLCPDYRALRGWLREHGAGLQRYRFGD